MPEPTKNENTSPSLPSRFAQTDEEAEQRFQEFETVDPFPDIAPALLNSADICDYVATTAMIHPFYERAELLKPASYEVALLGDYFFWDERGEKHGGKILRGQEFKLRRNSITFVTVEPMFRLPQYIALRFNLRITHIHRGILLGTGPLVDPGFTGKLLIPLHNLTTNDYVLVGGETLIWMEFTKLSSRSEWKPAKDLSKKVSRTKVFYDFPKDKRGITNVESFLRKADPHRPIRSSISDALENAVKQAKSARKTNQLFAGISVIAIVGVVITILSYFATTNSYLRRSRDDLDVIRLDLQREKETSKYLQTQIDDLQSQINSARASKPGDSIIHPSQ